MRILPVVLSGAAAGIGLGNVNEKTNSMRPRSAEPILSKLAVACNRCGPIASRETDRSFPGRAGIGLAGGRKRYSEVRKYYPLEIEPTLLQCFERMAMDTLVPHRPHSTPTKTANPTIVTMSYVLIGTTAIPCYRRGMLCHVMSMIYVD